MFLNCVKKFKGANMLFYSNQFIALTRYYLYLIESIISILFFKFVSVDVQDMHGLSDIKQYSMVDVLF